MGGPVCLGFVGLCFLWFSEETFITGKFILLGFEHIQQRGSLNNPVCHKRVGLISFSFLICCLLGWMGVGRRYGGGGGVRGGYFIEVLCSNCHFWCQKMLDRDRSMTVFTQAFGNIDDLSYVVQLVVASDSMSYPSKDMLQKFLVVCRIL